MNKVVILSDLADNYTRNVESVKFSRNFFNYKI